MFKKQKFYVVKQSDENLGNALMFSKKKGIYERSPDFPKSPQQAYERLSPYALEGARGQLFEIIVRPLTKMSKIKSHPKKNKK